MVAFTPIVQADFSGTAFGGTPTWTDITRFARLKAAPVTINKWRQDALSDVAPSTVTLTLDNSDLPGDATAPNAGRFTPGLSTSPWYPKIRSGVRLRLGVIVASVTYWRFDGYVDIWDASADGGDFPVCTVSASDMLAQLGNTDPLHTILLEELLADSPAALYPLTEPSTSTVASDISGFAAADLAVDTSNGGSATFGSATGAPTDGSATLALNTSLSTSAADDFVGTFLAGIRRDIALPLVFGVFDQTIEAFITVNATLVLAMARNPSAPALVAFVGDGATYSSGTPLALVYSAGGIYFGKQGGGAVGTDLNDGQLHHIAIVFASGAGTRTYYVDSVAVGTEAVGSGAPTSSRVYVGAVPGSVFWHGAYTTPTIPFRGGVGYVTVTPQALPAARVAAHNNAARTAFAGEGTAAHITRLLTYRTNLGATLAAGQGTIGAHATSGQTLAGALLATAKAEGGILYADPASGKIVLLDRTKMRNPSVAATLDVGAEQVDASLRHRVDRAQILNDATITRPGGAAQRRVDQTSKNTYGVGALNDNRIVGTDTEALNTAGWLVANGKDQRVRVPTFAADLLTEPNTTIAANVLNLTPLARVSLTNPPGSIPTADVIIEGCTDTIGVDVFNCSFFTSPLWRPTLRFDAAASAYTKLDSGNVFAW